MAYIGLFVILFSFSLRLWDLYWRRKLLDEAAAIKWQGKGLCKKMVENSCHLHTFITLEKLQCVRISYCFHLKLIWYCNPSVHDDLTGVWWWTDDNTLKKNSSYCYNMTLKLEVVQSIDKRRNITGCLYEARVKMNWHFSLSTYMFRIKQSTR
jgi:hypothetical protein